MTAVTVEGTTTTIGTGSITIAAAAVPGYLPWTTVPAGTVPYALLDGAASESGWGNWDGASQLTRTGITASTNIGGPIPLSGNNAIVVLQVGGLPLLISTGDVKWTIKTVADPGWALMNDGTIGNTGSGATLATAAAQNLFALIFANITDAWAPLQTSIGAATTRAAQTNAAAAWTAKCRMKLPLALGRAFAAAGGGAGLTARALGSYVGEEAHQLTAAEMASHVHVWNASQITNPVVALTGGGSYAVLNGPVFGSNTTSTGNDQPHNTMQPTSFFNVMIKL